MDKNSQIFDSNVNVSFVHESQPKPKRNKNFDCDKCKSVFEDKVQLNAHLKKVHLNEKPYQCSVCKRQFSLKVKLQKHVIKFHQPQLSQFSQKMPKMAKNGQMFDSKMDASVADKSKLKPKKFKCNECGKSFAYKEILKSHVDVVHAKYYTLDVIQKE